MEPKLREEIRAFKTDTGYECDINASPQECAYLLATIVFGLMQRAGIGAVWTIISNAASIVLHKDQIVDKMEIKS